MKMTNEERQALIGMLEGEIARYERLGMSGVDKGTSCHELDQWFRMSAYRLALAALTAEPYCHAIERPSNGELVVLNAPRKGTFPLFRYAPTELAVKLPKEKYIDVENDSMDDVSLAEDMGYNRCLADIRRLNAIDNTAQQYEALAEWKMVPIEPTAAMYDAGDKQLATKQVWDAMLAAAPKPEDKC